MKVLLSAVGSRGDVQPLAALGAALLRAGHEAVLAIPPDGAAVARAHGVPFVECGRDMTSWMAETEVTRMSPVAGMREFKRVLEKDIPLQMPVLLDAARGAHVVVGAGLQALGPTVADAVGAVGVYAYYGPSLLISAEHPPMFIEAQGLPRFVNRALHSLNSLFFDHVVMPSVNAQRVKHNLAPHVKYLEALPRHVLFAWDSALAPVPTDVMPIAKSLGVDVTFHEVGALLPDPARGVGVPADAALEAFLSSSDTPCVYVGFGSMPDKSPAETLALVDAAAARAHVRVVLLAPLIAASAGVSVSASNRVYVARGNVDHATLFPRMHAIVHHCGAGTTAAASRSGAPQIGVPHFLDQSLWARRIEQRGISAATLTRKSLTSSSLARAMRRCIDDAALRAHARTMRDALCATDPLAAGVRAIEAIGSARAQS